MNKLLSLLLTLLLWFIQQPALAQAPSQSSDPTKSLTCLITTDFYIVHLTAYQEPTEKTDAKRFKFTPYCQELPEVSKSYLAIDFIDRDLRQMPIELKVIEEHEDPKTGEFSEGSIIAHNPAQNFKNGVAQIEATFPKPGHYALIALVGDDMFADKIRIPLRVGIGSPFDWTSLLPYLYLILVILFAYGLFRFSVYRHNKKKAQEL